MNPGGPDGVSVRTREIGVGPPGIPKGKGVKERGTSSYKTSRVDRDRVVSVMDSELRSRLEKIRRLMEAAGTVGEAESAAAAFQRLILKHNLTEEDLKGLGEERSEAYGGLFIRVAPDRKPGIQWRLNLVYVLAEYSFCAFIRYGVHGATGVIVGQSSNQEAVKSMFQSTVETVDRLAEQDWYLFNNSYDWIRAGKPTATGWKNSFKIGFAEGLRQKMRNERSSMAKELEAGVVSALVVVKDAELKEAVQRVVGKTTTHKGSAPTNRDGYQRGLERGLAHELRERLA